MTGKEIININIINIHISYMYLRNSRTIYLNTWLVYRFTMTDAVNMRSHKQK